MFKSLLVLTSFYLLLSATTYAASINLGPKNSSSQRVTLDFSGDVHDKSNTFTAIRKRLNDAKTTSKVTKGEAFLLNYVDANMSGDKEAILKMWAPSERSEIGEMMSDPEALRANTAYFSNIVSSVLMASMEYGDYDLYYVSHKLKGSPTRIPQVYAVLRSDSGELFASNGLAEDFYYSRMSDVIAEYLANQVLKLR